jgi:hypothetical protein
MTDYWVSKLFFDLQHDAKLADQYRSNMSAVIDRYQIKPEVRKALLEDDVCRIAPLVNAYLLRFYFQVRGMPESEFIGKLRALAPSTSWRPPIVRKTIESRPRPQIGELRLSCAPKSDHRLYPSSRQP